MNAIFTIERYKTRKTPVCEKKVGVFSLQLERNKLYYHWMVFRTENCTNTYMFKLK